MSVKSVFYRIYTQNIPARRKKVIRILKEHGFQNFTLFAGVGYWEGGKEKSLMIEVVVKHPGRDKAIESATKEIGSRNKNGKKAQDAMLLVRHPAKQSFFERGKHYAHYAPGAVIREVGDPWVMPEPPNRPYRGRIILACGDWQKLLPDGAEKVNGRMLVRFAS